MKKEEDTELTPVGITHLNLVQITTGKIRGKTTLESGIEFNFS